MEKDKIDNCTLSTANCKYILSIAGFDPSSGAGVTSDIKTFDVYGFYGLSVCTAVTVQNDVDFNNCHWIPTEIILEQIEILFERFEINVVKIGIIKNWRALLDISLELKRLNPSIKIVLDPVLKASAGYDFHSNEEQGLLEEILKHCYIITPNYDEIKALYPEKDIEETLESFSQHTNVYLKGGHRIDKKGWDELYHSKIVMVNIPPNIDEVSDKHGSGCVLSSSLACNIALDQELEDAARATKHYTEQFLNSNKSLLGTHTRIQKEETTK